MSQPNDRDQEAGSGDEPGPQYMGRAAIAQRSSCWKLFTRAEEKELCFKRKSMLSYLAQKLEQGAVVIFVLRHTSSSTARPATSPPTSAGEPTLGAG